MLLFGDTLSLGADDTVQSALGGGLSIVDFLEEPKKTKDDAVESFKSVDGDPLSFRRIVIIS